MNNKVLKLKIEKDNIEDSIQGVYYFNDCFDAYDYIEALNKGIELAKKGYRVVKLDNKPTCERTK